MVIGQFRYETYRVRITFPAQISLMIAINYLTHSHTMTLFDTRGKQAF